MLTFLSVGVFVFYYIGLINMLYACPTHINLKVYRPRKPQDSAYYRCVEDCFETFEQVYQERFERKYGFFRTYVRQVIYRYPWPRPGLLFQLQGTRFLNNEPKP